MTALFVREFKDAHKCPSCPRSKVPARSLCALHLAYARRTFMVWSQKRRREGLCISCNEASMKGWLRCPEHREVNRQRSLAWSKAHPDRSHTYWLERKAWGLRTGLCIYCADHKPVIAGTLRCRSCKKKMLEAHKRQKAVRA